MEPFRKTKVCLASPRAQLILERRLELLPLLRRRARQHLAVRVVCRGGRPFRLLFPCLKEAAAADKAVAKKANVGGEAVDYRRCPPNQNIESETAAVLGVAPCPHSFSSRSNRKQEALWKQTFLYVRIHEHASTR